MDCLHSNPIANDIDHFKSQYVVIHTTSFWKVLDLNGWLQTADNRYFKPASICHFAWQSFDLACPSGRGLHELYIYIYIYSPDISITTGAKISRQEALGSQHKYTCVICPDEDVTHDWTLTGCLGMSCRTRQWKPDRSIPRHVTAKLGRGGGVCEARIHTHSRTTTTPETRDNKVPFGHTVKSKVTSPDK